MGNVTVNDAQRHLDRIAQLATSAHVGMSDRKRSLMKIRDEVCAILDEMRGAN